MPQAVATLSCEKRRTALDFEDSRFQAPQQQPGIYAHLTAELPGLATPSHARGCPADEEEAAATPATVLRPSAPSTSYSPSTPTHSSTSRHVVTAPAAQELTPVVRASSRWAPGGPLASDAPAATISTILAKLRALQQRAVEEAAVMAKSRDAGATVLGARLGAAAGLVEAQLDTAVARVRAAAARVEDSLEQAAGILRTAAAQQATAGPTQQGTKTASDNGGGYGGGSAAASTSGAPGAPPAPAAAAAAASPSAPATMAAVTLMRDSTTALLVEQHPAAAVASPQAEIKAASASPQPQSLFRSGCQTELYMKLPINIVTYNIHSLKEAASDITTGAAARAAEDNAKKAAAAADVAAGAHMKAAAAAANAAAAAARADCAKATVVAAAFKTLIRKVTGKANKTTTASKKADKETEAACTWAETARTEATNAAKHATTAMVAAGRQEAARASQADKEAAAALKRAAAATSKAQKAAELAMIAEERALTAAEEAMQFAQTAEEKLRAAGKILGRRPGCDGAAPLGAQEASSQPGPSMTAVAADRPRLAEEPAGVSGSGEYAGATMEAEAATAAGDETAAAGDETDLLLLEGVLSTVIDNAGWALPYDVQSPGRLDVVCLQEVRVAKERSDLLHRLLKRLREKWGYDYVTAGEQVIVWNKSTMERVTDRKQGSGADAADCSVPDTSPNYVWCRKNQQQKPLLDAAWGAAVSEFSSAYQAACAKMEVYAAQQRGTARSRPADADSFFRYPPITVVLRRRFDTTGSNTTYVITTAHTPGSGRDLEDGVQHLDQLAREVAWLLDRSTYKRVMEHMAELNPELCAYNDKGGLLPSTARQDVVHVVAGDFNTQLYERASSDRADRGGRLGLPPLRGAGKPAQDAWLAYQGSEEKGSEPTTASKYPDVVYVLKDCTRDKYDNLTLYNTGLQVLPLARTGARLFSGSDHKPLLVSFREERQEARPVRSLAEAVSSILKQRVQEAVNLMRAEVQGQFERLVQAVPAQAVMAQLHGAHPMMELRNKGAPVA